MISQRGTILAGFFRASHKTRYHSRVTGTMIIPIKKPMVMMVETRLSSFTQSHIRSDKVSRKKSPQIKASLDKNKSQRIGILL